MPKKSKSRRSRGYARRAGAGVKRAGRSMLSIIGFKRDGFHASDAMIFGGLAATVIMPSYGTYSAVDYLAGHVPNNTSITARITGASYAMANTGLGWKVPGTSNAVNSGVGGTIVVAGVVTKIVSTAVNPLMKGSFVKL